jgi:hypothetical protein
MAVTYHPALAHSPGLGTAPGLRRRQALGQRPTARKRWQVPPSPVRRDPAAERRPNCAKTKGPCWPSRSLGDAAAGDVCALPQLAVVVLHVSDRFRQAGLAKTLDACCDEWQVRVGNPAMAWPTSWGVHMSNPGNGPTTPPGWHPDPAGTGRLRWWDGAAWTDQFSAPPPVSPYTAPYASPSYTPQRPQISSNTPVYNPLIWIITLLPLLALVLLLLWNPEFRVIYVGSRNTPTLDPSSVFTPVYFVMVFSGSSLTGLPCCWHISIANASNATEWSGRSTGPGASSAAWSTSSAAR